MTTTSIAAPKRYPGRPLVALTLEPDRPVLAPEEMFSPMTVSPVASVTVPPTVGLFAEPQVTRVTIPAPS
jgi:hypothetical protein